MKYVSNDPTISFFIIKEEIVKASNVNPEQLIEDQILKIEGGDQFSPAEYMIVPPDDNEFYSEALFDIINEYKEKNIEASVVDEENKKISVVNESKGILGMVNTIYYVRAIISHKEN